jgi:hypothetical protein
VSSRPLIPGKLTSRTRQSGLRAGADFKKSSAEANSFTSRWTDLISLSSDFRTESIIIHHCNKRCHIDVHFLHSGGERIYYTFVVVHDWDRTV